MQQRVFVTPVWESRLLQRVARELQHRQQDAQESNEVLNPGAKLQDLLLQLKGIPTQDIDGNDVGFWFCQPATRRGPRNAPLDGTTDVTGCLHEVSQAMIITALHARCDCHAAIMASMAHGASKLWESQARNGHHGEN